MCKHEGRALMGTDKGIVCRACGMIFPSFAALEAARKPALAVDTVPGISAPVEAAEKPKKARKKKDA